MKGQLPTECRPVRILNRREAAISVRPPPPATVTPGPCSNAMVADDTFAICCPVTSAFEGALSAPPRPSNTFTSWNKHSPEAPAPAHVSQPALPGNPKQD
jgi:hypothetical protein